MTLTTPVIGILGGELVAAHAMCFTSVDCRPIQAAARVLLSGYWFQVGRIDTGGITAEMINMEPIGDRPNEQFVCETVRTRMSAIQGELAVAGGVSRSDPRPAFIVTLSINFRPEPFGQRAVFQDTATLSRTGASPMRRSFATERCFTDRADSGSLRMHRNQLSVAGRGRSQRRPAFVCSV